MNLCVGFANSFSCQPSLTTVEVVLRLSKSFDKFSPVKYNLCDDVSGASLFLETNFALYFMQGSYVLQTVKFAESH